MADNDTTKRKPNRGVMLPVLPKGWIYQTVILTGPRGGQVTVDASGAASGHYNVTTVADDIEKRHSTATTLAEGAKAAQSGAKALVKITEAEAAAKQARLDGLDLLGKTGRDEPTSGPDETGPEQPDDEIPAAPATTAGITASSK